MSRRARALAFAAAALACAALAARLAGGYRSDVAEQYGPLRDVVVAVAPLAAARVLSPADAERRLEVRRVPERFTPPGALAAATEAVGLAPLAPIEAGAYVLASQLAARAARPGRARGVPGPGRSAVEIAVVAAGPLAAGRRRPELVDVVVTTESGPAGRGRTYVAARDVRLLDLAPAAEAVEPLPGAAPASIATLALTRSQALRLIQAESFARQVRLIAG